MKRTALLLLLTLIALLTGCASEIKRDAMNAQIAQANAQAEALKTPLLNMEFGPDGRPTKLVVGQQVGGQGAGIQIQAPKSDVAEALTAFGGVLNSSVFNTLSAGWAAKELAGAVKANVYDNHAIDNRPVDNHAVDNHPVDSHAVDYRPVDNHAATTPVASVKP